ncbi:lipopolysaccharide biosynthesis protein [Crenobacter intestini]|uniref:Oligosaccharide flippase family protein n=1 Tax=Crenobacter intestini TaxID=2563443 RepID=A0A4T0UL83_9NEIS|nr:oligosaccharide flippase family protein [Crenobacter intestini]TIC78985.1 hypothetical protein E5K04_14600 [Crenobacter intestini]
MLNHIKKLLFGNGIAQAIQLSSLLILSRIYSASDFGFLAQIQAFATFSTIIATLQLHLAIPLSHNENEARSLTNHTQSIALFFAFLFLVPSLIIGSLGIYTLWLTLSIAIINTCNGYLIYRGCFAKISKYYIVRAGFVVFLQLIFALFKVKDGLVLGTLLAETITAIFLMKFGLDHRTKFSMHLPDLANTARTHKSFCLYGTSQELVSVAAFYAPLILFGIYFDSSITGQYAMASRLIWAPTVLISKNIAQVVYHRSAQPTPFHLPSIKNIKSNGKIIFAIPIILIIISCSEHIIPIIIGDEWKLTAKITPIISIWALAFLIATPFRVLYRTYKLQKTLLIFDSLLLTGIIASFLAKTSALNTVTTIASIAAALQIITIFTIVKKINKLQIKLKQPSKRE